MLKIKDLLDRGALIQERAANVSCFSNFEDLENLTPEDIRNGNYSTYEVEVAYENADFDLWIELEGEDSYLSFTEFEKYMNECNAVEEFVEKLKNK